MLINQSNSNSNLNLNSSIQSLITAHVDAVMAPQETKIRIKALVSSIQAIDPKQIDTAVTSLYVLYTDVLKSLGFQDVDKFDSVADILAFSKSWGIWNLVQSLVDKALGLSPHQ